MKRRIREFLSFAGKLMQLIYSQIELLSIKIGELCFDRPFKLPPAKSKRQFLFFCERHLFAAGKMPALHVSKILI